MGRSGVPVERRFHLGISSRLLSLGGWFAHLSCVHALFCSLNSACPVVQLRPYSTGSVPVSARSRSGSARAVHLAPLPSSQLLFRSHIPVHLISQPYEKAPSRPGAVPLRADPVQRALSPSVALSVARLRAATWARRSKRRCPRARWSKDYHAVRSVCRHGFHAHKAPVLVP